MTQKKDNAKSPDWKEVFGSGPDGLRALVQQVVQEQAFALAQPVDLPCAQNALFELACPVRGQDNDSAHDCDTQKPTGCR